MLRIALFLITNMAVLFVFNIILTLTGIQSQDATGLLIFAALFGFSGSLISLFMSKSMALKAVGAQIIKQANTPQEIWLRDTVEQLATKDNLPIPDIAIYHSSDVNAFATGASKKNSLVAVSSGLLNNMSQDEAEAVLAHEISHIANGDMITMTLLQGVLNTFVIFLSRIIASAISNSGNNQGRSASYFLVAMVLELVFGFLASLIAMWFSRYREFRADAGSANLVGKQKMIAALKRLQSIHEPQDMGATLSAFAINGKHSTPLTALLMSHPPLEKRIAALQKL